MGKDGFVPEESQGAAVVQSEQPHEVVSRVLTSMDLQTIEGWVHEITIEGMGDVKVIPYNSFQQLIAQLQVIES